MALKQTGNFVGNVMFDRGPVELFEHGHDVCMFRLHVYNWLNAG